MVYSRFCKKNTKYIDVLYLAEHFDMLKYSILGPKGILGHLAKNSHFVDEEIEVQRDEISIQDSWLSVISFLYQKSQSLY